MGPFIPNLSTLTSPLRELVKDKSVFDWSPAHQDAFDKVKNAISTETTMGYYDPTKEIILQADASTTGLGAPLLQDQKPIAFASKTLTDTESRYANIERELLAVVYGCERFHTYLFGRSFVAESDHKPLESIQMKNLVSAPPRLQRMLLRLQPYDVTIRYRPGKQMHVADALSRLSSDEAMPIPDLNVQIHEVCPQFSNEYLQKIQEETLKDPELAALKEVVFKGWPNTIKELSPVVAPLLELSRRTLNRRRFNYETSPDYNPASVARRYISQASCQSSRDREDKAKSTHVSIVEKHQQGYCRSDQILQGVPGTPTQPTTRAPIANRSPT